MPSINQRSPDLNSGSKTLTVQSSEEDNDTGQSMLSFVIKEKEQFVGLTNQSTPILEPEKDKISEIGVALRKFVSVNKKSKEIFKPSIDNIDNLAKNNINELLPDNNIEHGLNNDLKLAEDAKTLIERIKSPYKEETHATLLAIKNLISELLPENNYGQLMDVKQVEVLKMLTKGKSGEKVIAPYNRAQWKDPLNYLEYNFGQYLSRFNTEKKDFIFLPDIEVFSPNFRNTLRSFLKSRNKEISDYVLNRSDSLDQEVTCFSHTISSTYTSTPKQQYLLRTRKKTS